MVRFIEISIVVALGHALMACKKPSPEDPMTTGDSSEGSGDTSPGSSGQVGDSEPTNDAWYPSPDNCVDDVVAGECDVLDSATCAVGNACYLDGLGKPYCGGSQADPEFVFEDTPCANDLECLPGQDCVGWQFGKSGRCKTLCFASEDCGLLDFGDDQRPGYCKRGYCHAYCDPGISGDQCAPGERCARITDDCSDWCLTPKTSNCLPQSGNGDCVANDFICETMTGEGYAGDPCLTEYSCFNGLQCVETDYLVGCEDDTACCTPYCSTLEPDPCEGGNTCIPLYPDHQIGLCLGPTGDPGPLPNHCLPQ